MRFVTVLTMAVLAASAAEAEEQVFPVPLDNSQELYDVNMAWFSEHLAAMKEPSLWKETPKAETYRIWLRGSHASMAFRWTLKPDGTSELVTKKTDEHGGYGAGKLVLEKTTRIDKRETEILLAGLALQNFWTLQSQRQILGGLDGASWIIEGAKDGKYHTIDSWGPGSLMDWALSLITKSGENLKPYY